MVLEMLKDQRFDQAAKSAAHGGGLLARSRALTCPLMRRTLAISLGLSAAIWAMVESFSRRRVGSH